MIGDPQSRALAQKVITRAASEGLTAATAESCTGGLISAALTSVPGSSAVFTHGFVTYANEAKIDLLGVRKETLDDHGAVSRCVAMEMATGARARSGADIAVSVTGVAGPGGGTAEKPVGLVWFGLSGPFGTISDRRLFPGHCRDLVRTLAMRNGLRLLLRGIDLCGQSVS
ncbi:CinA family protein [Parvularcula lutaonensis]|uniref:CinA family protein n=1 Tax=Parvularcula lutaonensis TaxID=491923 RepID=A0ABV7MBM7_9PROT|nr:CinA family protein [Parvularcula lutaonensis]GGY40218.1 competence damage-inducible protein A [Parvularcula lutaonensis]